MLPEGVERGAGSPSPCPLASRFHPELPTRANREVPHETPGSRQTNPISAQGNRMNVMRRGVPAGTGRSIPPSSAFPRRDPAPGPAENVHPRVPDDGKAGGAVVPSDPAVVLAETHIEHPVEAVPDHPVRAHRVGEEFRVQRQGRDEVPCPRPGLPVVVPDEDDAADAGRIPPSGVALPGHPISSHRVHVRISTTPLSPSTVRWD